ncbi:MAG: hypothetical protein LQ346_006974 [Caloplaca aetnensis]|nr:MAG: hypothetical protein LQ346_006974 [Caloplaca aetnensis]
MVEADIAERPFSAAAHLGEDDIGDLDAPGEEVEEDQPSKPSPEPVAPKPKRGRPRKNPDAPPKPPKVSSPLAITSSERRRPTPAEQEEANRLADEAEEAIDATWVSRASKKALKVKRDRYRAIANGDWIEASTPAAEPKKQTRKKRHVEQTEDESEFRDLDEMGNTPAQAQFLEKKRQKYIKDHPEFYRKVPRRRAQPQPKTDSESEDYPVKPRTAKKSKTGGDQERDAMVDYDAFAVSDVPDYRSSYSRRSNSLDTTRRRQPPTSSDLHDYPASLTQPLASSSRTSGRPTSQSQSENLTSFEQRFKLLSQGPSSTPTRNYPPGFGSDIASTATFGRSQVGGLRPSFNSSATVGRPVTGTSSSHTMAPPRRRRREPDIVQPEGLSGIIPNVTGRDYASGIAMKRKAAVDKALYYEKDVKADEGEDEHDDDAVEGAKEAEQQDYEDEETTGSEDEDGGEE